MTTHQLNQTTSEKIPPPGFEFVPIGNPDLTTACKEISREREALIFIVSTAKNSDAQHLSQQIHRIGHHIRETIVAEARTSLNLAEDHGSSSSNELEAIPTSEAQYHAQVDAAIRDLFPRIPNTDRQQIIDTSFTRSRATANAAAAALYVPDALTGEPKDGLGQVPVGLSMEIPLARRVQLAVLAHIRHTHTRYDELLKETSWNSARKAVETLCLDTLVKWRGDEETGRDQLDEILQEVVVISDSDDESEESEESDSSEASSSDEDEPPRRRRRLDSDVTARQPRLSDENYPSFLHVDHSSRAFQQTTADDIARRRRQGFRRYQAWEEAIRRNRIDEAPRYSPMPLDDISRYRTPPVAGPPSHFKPQVLAPVYAIPIKSPSPPTVELKDMLVRSIEPESGEIPGATFIRTLPPRQLIPLDSLAREPPARYHEYQHSGGSPYQYAPHAPALQQHPVMQDRLHGGHAPIPIPNPQVHNHFHMTDPNPGFTSSSLPATRFYEPERRPRQQSNSPDLPPAKRIVLDAARPGERPTQVIMEDRGGFYEKVFVDTPPPGAVLIKDAPYPSPVAHGYLPDARGPPPAIHTNHGLVEVVRTAPYQGHVPHPTASPSRIPAAFAHAGQHHTDAGNPYIAQPVFYRIERSGGQHAAVPQYADRPLDSPTRGRRNMDYE
ncbi:hypothetical protein VHEMI01776 [[Torrubiella] hemipterigena]|uniref:DUF2293 domain-containing protein n=1 Tax=[Torrubiella] hemipterigena TaxID=1531966 RepID=A0A0A1SMW0_9HYPO|nr:hypothetical protein VHEMI01776 [[Torrubiella] hemipterigena]